LLSKTSALIIAIYIKIFPPHPISSRSLRAPPVL
jgi:hypothetical protein